MARIPPPIPELLDDPATHDWAQRLSAWLATEDLVESTLEEKFIFGSDEVASKIFGIEALFTGHTAPYSEEVLAAPEAGKKRVLVWLSIASDSPTTQRQYRVYKKKGATEYDIFKMLLKVNDVFSSGYTQVAVLDDTDETIRLEAVDGDEDVHFNGAYLDVD
jgi:hypothetical protein